jgi:hypothetical protein
LCLLASLALHGAPSRADKGATPDTLLWRETLRETLWLCWRETLREPTAPSSPSVLPLKRWPEWITSCRVGLVLKPSRSSLPASDPESEKLDPDLVREGGLFWILLFQAFAVGLDWEWDRESSEFSFSSLPTSGLRTRSDSLLSPRFFFLFDAVDNEVSSGMATSAFVEL